MSTFTYEKVGQYGSEVVARIVADKGRVKAIDCSEATSFSRKVIDELTEYLKQYQLNWSVHLGVQ